MKRPVPPVALLDRAQARPQSAPSLPHMRMLLAFPILLAATAAQAQYPTYPQVPSVYPPPPGYPPGSDAGEAPGDRSAFPAEAGSSARSLARETLAPQNAVRASIGEPPLQWSRQLADIAQDWAEHLIATGRFVHRPFGQDGENLYEITGGSASPQQVVDAWADEARDYDIRTNTCTAVCGHYTQIVWRSTRAAGCGVAGDADREVWVCEYYPPGNVVGERPY